VRRWKVVMALSRVDQTRSNGKGSNMPYARHHLPSSSTANPLPGPLHACHAGSHQGQFVSQSQHRASWHASDAVKHHIRFESVVYLSNKPTNPSTTTSPVPR
jgi:hypothetical protein